MDHPVRCLNRLWRRWNWQFAFISLYIFQNFKNLRCYSQKASRSLASCVRQRSLNHSLPLWLSLFYFLTWLGIELEEPLKIIRWEADPVKELWCCNMYAVLLGSDDGASKLFKNPSPCRTQLKCCCGVVLGRGFKGDFSGGTLGAVLVHHFEDLKVCLRGGVSSFYIRHLFCFIVKDSIAQNHKKNASACVFHLKKPRTNSAQKQQ